MLRPEFSIEHFDDRHFDEESDLEDMHKRHGAAPRGRHGKPVRRRPGVQLPCVCPGLDIELVRWVQHALNQVAGAALAVDGVMSATTRRALRRFQRRHQLDADGIAGPDTQTALMTALRAGASNVAHEASELDFHVDGLPRSVKDALAAKDEAAALRLAAAAGFSDEATLVDLVFGARHPERSGAPLRNGEPNYGALAAEWLQIRDRQVRPMLKQVAGGSKVAPPRQASAPNIVSVRGIQVDPSIAGPLEALLAAAEAEGVPLGGSGYRSPDQQVATRRKNCGPTDWDIYQKPSSQCSPPTALPGTSMHERGLAIDFKYGNGAQEFAGTPGFAWMQRNAGRFGLINFSKEPWHWSTTGT